MRFVIFNLAVLVGLGYLLFGDPAKRPAWLAPANVEVPAPLAAVAPAPVPDVLPEPKPATQPEPVPEREVETVPVAAPPPPAPPPAPAAVVEDAAQTPLLPVAVVEPKPEPVPVLMSPRERRRELDRLVDDMEGVFLDKLAR